jgi:hypothetical protein
VGNAVGIEDLDRRRIEVGILHAAPELQLQRPVVQDLAHDERRMVHVGRDENRVWCRVPAAGDHEVAGAVATQVHVSASPRPRGDPVEYPVLAPGGGGDARELHEPLAMVDLLLRCRHRAIV